MLVVYLLQLLGLIVGGLLIGAWVSPRHAWSDPVVNRPVPSCEDQAGDGSERCAWDARHGGNGTGRSYVTGRNGQPFTVPHWVAHRLRPTDTSTVYSPVNGNRRSNP